MTSFPTCFDTAIGLIVDGLDGSADILKFGFHYSIAGFEIYMGEMLLAVFILLLFGYLNIIGVRKAAIVQSVLSSTLIVCSLTLFIASFFREKAQIIHFHPIWGFDKHAAIAANATTATIDSIPSNGNTFGLTIETLNSLSSAKYHLGHQHVNRFSKKRTINKKPPNVGK